MRPIFLLSVNFVRSQWIAVAIMTAYLGAAGALFGWHEQQSDVQFYLQWHSYNALLIGMLIAVPALWSERRSRRVLAVLSKGITRAQYLGGILLGCSVISAWFCLLIGSITAWLCRYGGIPMRGLFPLMLLVFLCSVTAESAALLSAVILHPLLAMLVATGVLLFPLVLQPAGWYPAGEAFPVASLIAVVKDYHFQPPGTGLWRIGAAAIVEIILFWAIASAIFSRKDVTISPE